LICGDPDRLDEPLRRGAGPAVVVQPAAPVHDVVLLEDAQAGSDDRRVAKAEDVPAVLGRVLVDRPLEPRDLPRVREHLVGRVRRIAEHRRPEADEQRLGRDLVRELGRLLAHDP